MLKDGILPLFISDKILESLEDMKDAVLDTGSFSHVGLQFKKSVSIAGSGKV